MFTLPPLPYNLNALSPHLSEETLQYHYGKHHQAYVDKLNTLIQNTSFETLSLEDIIRSSDGNLFNNAAQTWNHTFYFLGLSPVSSSSSLSKPFLELVNQYFVSLDLFKKKFNDLAMNTFGSGWVWLIKNREGALDLLSTRNAENPLKQNKIPLLTCDLWEHAYYIDYRNARAKYLDAFWNIVNWNTLEKNYYAS